MGKSAIRRILKPQGKPLPPINMVTDFFSGARLIFLRFQDGGWKRRWVLQLSWDSGPPPSFVPLQDSWACPARLPSVAELSHQGPAQLQWAFLPLSPFSGSSHFLLPLPGPGGHSRWKLPSEEEKGEEDESRGQWGREGAVALDGAIASSGELYKGEENVELKPGGEDSWRGPLPARAAQGLLI